MFTGSVALPVSAEAVILPLAPTFTVATANAPVPFIPEIFTIPSLVVVAAKATMSGTGVDDAENKRVFSPGAISAAALLLQRKNRRNSSGRITPVAVKVKTNDCAVPLATSIGVF